MDSARTSAVVKEVENVLQDLRGYENIQACF